MAHTFHFQIYYDSVTAHSSGLFVILIYRLLGTKEIENIFQYVVNARTDILVFQETE